MKNVFSLLRAKMVHHFYVSKDIFSKYKSGNISKKIMYDFLLFKIRSMSAKYLGNGLLTSRKKDCDLVYYDGDRKFCVRFPKDRGVRQIVKVEWKGKDVTERFFEFLGPGHNFHGIVSTPLLLGWGEEITVIYRNNKKITYQPSDKILLSV